MSLNIAVCEDDEKDAEMLYALLDIVCREWKLAAQIHRYVSAEELLAKCNTPPQTVQKPLFPAVCICF